MRDDTVDEGPRLDRVEVVLHRPRSPENIGAAARAMWNMGLSRLRLVGPVRWDEAAMHRTATREAGHIIREAEIHDSLEAALAVFHLVVGTTARVGDLRGPLWTPWLAAKRIVDLGGQDRVALLFGPEDRGLTNQELRLCHMLVRIPTDRFASLNVAQAVLVMSYELHKAAAAGGEPSRGLRGATVEELERMYSHLEETLLRLCVISAENPRRGMMKVRRFLSRVHLRPQEVQMIRGLCRQIEWYGEKRTKDGSEEKGLE